MIQGDKLPRQAGGRNPALHRNRVGPHPGLLIIPIAALISLYLVPQDTTTPGALMLSTWALTAGLGAAILLDISECGIIRVLRAENIVLIGLAVVVYPEVLGRSYTTTLTFEDIRRALLAIGLFATMVTLGSSLTPPKLPRVVMYLARRHYSRQILFRLLLLSWTLGMLSFAVASGFSLGTMFNGLFAGRFSSPWARGQLGDWDAFRDFLAYFGYSVPTFTVLLAVRSHSWTRPSVVASAFCSAILLAFVVQQGVRRICVVIIGAALLAWLCSKRRQLRSEHYIITAALVALSAVGLDIMLEERNSGFGEYSYSLSKFSGLRVDNNFQTLGDTLRVIPAETDYVGLNFLWYALVRPVPRVLWQGKPTDGGFDLAEHLGANGVALAITFVGEQYIGFGWMGIIVGGVGFGLLARSWSQLLEHDFGIAGSALYALGTMALFLGIRSTLELILMSYPIICWYVLDRVFVRSRRIITRLVTA